MAADLQHFHITEDVGEGAGLPGVFMGSCPLLSCFGYDILHQGKVMLRERLPDLANKGLELGSAGIRCWDVDWEM